MWGRLLSTMVSGWVELGSHSLSLVSQTMSTNSPSTNSESSIHMAEQLRPTDDINTGGVKFDNGKTRDDLLPPELEEAVAKVLAFGAQKYAARNWEKGMDWSRPYAAARRHLRNWFARRDFGKGEGNDADSGFSDLHHAACNIAFLIAYEARGIGTDDRPKVK